MILLVIAAIIIVLWLIGWLALHLIGAFIHILLIIAIIIIIIALVSHFRSA